MRRAIDIATEECIALNGDLSKLELLIHHVTLFYFKYIANFFYL